MQEAARDAAGRTFYVGDTVGGTTLKTVTIVGEVVDIEPTLVKVRLETDGVPAVRGGPAPLKGAEILITTRRAFLVRRAAKSRQVLFTGDVDDTLPADRRQESAWLLNRAVGGCDCTDPEPADCTAGCYIASKGPQCRCHHVQTVGEIRALLTRVRAMNPIVDDLDGVRESLTESYVGCGLEDADSRRWAREFLAHHARALAVVTGMVGPHIAEDAGPAFAAGFTAHADYLRAYAYGLDPEGNGSL
ncbi:hypothetical protein ACKI16_29710 [Streptomyces scabiei]|uniref:hypothetical protein n=1 Tax=Streptomyces scabiei TaxID=1930 RepID=UPI0038F70C27